MNKKYWTCTTADGRIGVYIATSDDATVTQKYGGPEMQDAHMHAAREALYHYAESRSLELTGPLYAVDALPPESDEVACLFNVRPGKQSFSVSVTVFETSAESQTSSESTAKNDRRKVSLDQAFHIPRDGLDPERQATVADATTALNEVIFALEGVLDEDNENYCDLPESLRDAEDGTDAGKHREIIESAIRLPLRRKTHPGELGR